MKTLILLCSDVRTSASFFFSIFGMFHEKIKLRLQNVTVLTVAISMYRMKTSLLNSFVYVALAKNCLEIRKRGHRSDQK